MRGMQIILDSNNL